MALFEVFYQIGGLSGWGHNFFIALRIFAGCISTILVFIIKFIDIVKMILLLFYFIEILLLLDLLLYHVWFLFSRKEICYSTHFLTVKL